MAGMGTGTPLYFQCPAFRRVSWRLGELYGLQYLREVQAQHRVVRTGRTRPNPSRRRTQRTLGEMHEFRCSCGHVGWSRVAGILDYPVVP